MAVAGTSDNMEYSASALQMMAGENGLTMKRIDAAVAVLGLANVTEKLKITAEQFLISELEAPNNPFDALERP